MRPEYPKHLWPVTIVAFLAALVASSYVGNIALDHNPQGEFTEGDGPQLLSLMVSAYFLVVFFAIELPHQVGRLLLWGWRWLKLNRARSAADE